MARSLQYLITLNPETANMSILKLCDYPTLRVLMREAFPSYRKKSVIVTDYPQTEVTLSGTFWDGGSRSSYCRVHLHTPTVEHLSAPSSPPQFGGAPAPTAKLDETSMVVELGTFRGKPATAHIFALPAVIAFLKLPRLHDDTLDGEDDDPTEALDGGTPPAPRVKDIDAFAMELSDAYSTDRYRGGWRPCITMLRRRGLSDRQVEAVIRSKWTRWAADQAANRGKRYGQATSTDLEAFLETVSDPEIERLTMETFP